MKSIFPFHYLEPVFYSGLLDDPILLIRIRPEMRNILVDCGHIYHIAKRVLRAVDALFITHAHMDHFIGIDHFTRSVLVGGKAIDLIGPPGIATKLYHKLSGYNWNLVEEYYCSYWVHEVHPQCIKVFHLPGSQGFRKIFHEERQLHNNIVYENKHLYVEAILCDHKIPCLIYKFTEKQDFSVDGEKIQKMGLIEGPWLNQLKHQFHQNTLGQAPLSVGRQPSYNSENLTFTNTKELFARIKKDSPPRTIGYITDIGFTPENLAKVRLLMGGVTYLLSECTFLENRIERARKTFHLSTQDLNQLLQEIRPAFFLPMHLSKTYQHQTEQLYEELQLPEETQLLYIPARLTARPLLPHEIAPINP